MNTLTPETGAPGQRYNKAHNETSITPLAATYKASILVKTGNEGDEAFDTIIDYLNSEDGQPNTVAELSSCDVSAINRAILMAVKEIEGVEESIKNVVHDAQRLEIKIDVDNERILGAEKTFWADIINADSLESMPLERKLELLLLARQDIAYLRGHRAELHMDVDDRESMAAEKTRFTWLNWPRGERPACQSSIAKQE